MELSVNLVLAAVLTLCAAFVVGFSPWLRQRMDRYETLKTLSVAAALMLVPANLVFTWSGVLSAFTAIIVVTSILAVATQLGLLFLWYRGSSPAPTTLDDMSPTEEIPPMEQIRVLAVGTDVVALEREAGEVLTAFHKAGQEVTALVVADEAAVPVAAAQKTISMILPRQHLQNLQLGISEVAGEHISRIRPHIILAPSERKDFTGATAVHWATRRAAKGHDVLYYPPKETVSDEEFDPMSVEEQRRRDAAFQRPNESVESHDGRIRMPSFSGPWI